MATKSKATTAKADECERAKRQLGPANRVSEFDRLKAQKDAILTKDVSGLLDRIMRLEAALIPFRSGGDWGTWKAWLVEGTRVMNMSERGLDAAQQITRWQVIVDSVLGLQEFA